MQKYINKIISNKKVSVQKKKKTPNETKRNQPNGKRYLQTTALKGD